MLAKLSPYRLEIKYLVLTIILIGGLLLLARADAFHGLEGGMTTFMDDMAGLGLIGVFIVALIANASLLIQIPYTLPMLSVALYSDNLAELVALGVSTGIGAGLGEIVSYAIAFNIAAQIQELSKSSFFRWIRDTINDHPRSIPLFVFIGAVTPIPDDLVIMPLAVINYPIRKLLIPMFVGKIVHNFTVAFVFHYATEQVRGYVSGDINVDLSLGILIVFVLVIAYQIEKARYAIRNGRNEETASLDSTDEVPLSIAKS